MFRALWFMLKVGALVAAVVWIAQRPGFVRLEWLEYAFTVHVGLFLVFALGVILAAIFAYNLITAFVKFPSSWRRYKNIRDQEKGYEALTIGLTAVAAGDRAGAVKHARRAEKYLHDDTGLPLLLKAQAARLDGREEEALESFSALLEDKNAAFLGVRGLLQAAMDRADYEKALALANHALNLHADQPWIVKIIYDLYVRLQRWDEALSMLYRVEKTKALDIEAVRSSRVAILIALSEDQGLADAIKSLQRAVKIERGFAPSSARLSRLYLSEGQRRKGISVIKKAWKASPHPDLVEVWMLCMPARLSGEPLARMRWIEELLKVFDESAVAQLAAGQIALEHKLWGEARVHLMKALELEPSASVYDALAMLEDRSGQGAKAVAAWQEKAVVAPRDYQWICRETGRVYPQWSVIAMPHGGFNTIEWTRAQGGVSGAIDGKRQIGAVSGVLNVPDDV